MSANTDGALHAAQQLAAETARDVADAARNVADAAHALQDRSADALDEASRQMSTWAQDGLDAARSGSLRLQASARHAREDTSAYIRHEPLKAVLIAAAAGATLMALVQWARSPRSGR